jgi:hypothetical protein
MTKLEALTIYFGGQAHSPLNNTLIISSSFVLFQSYSRFILFDWQVVPWRSFWSWPSRLFSFVVFTCGAPQYPTLIPHTGPTPVSVVILTPTWQRHLIRLIRFCTRTCPMMGEIPSFSCSNYYLQFNTVNFIANNTCFNKPAVSGCNIDCSNKLSILDI